MHNLTQSLASADETELLVHFMRVPDKRILDGNIRRLRLGHLRTFGEVQRIKVENTMRDIPKAMR